MLRTLCVLLIAASPVYTIPQDKIDTQKVYYGDCNGSFTRAAEFDPIRVIENTKQYKKVQKEKIQTGTGKYWILMSQASDSMRKAVGMYMQDHDFDFLASQGYLTKATPEVPVVDVTDDVIKQLHNGGALVSTGIKGKTKRVEDSDGLVKNLKKKN